MSITTTLLLGLAAPSVVGGVAVTTSGAGVNHHRTDEIMTVKRRASKMRKVAMELVSTQSGTTNTFFTVVAVTTGIFTFF